ncbi:MAG: alpha/beta hydrolase [Alphaproteobacteria bacterium]|nr:alpha/beta hydrolase [Alphaproteobacteria bacterium]
MANSYDSIEAAGQRLECAWLGPAPSTDPNGPPTLVFLHEGLGCVALWRDFPAQLAAATGLGGFVYSRQGYGGSDPCALPRPITYMHDEGLRVLPALLAAAGIKRTILVGHSDGASIALIYAGGTPATALAGLILEAPHVFMEECNAASIAEVREIYATGDLRQRLAKYHGDNVDCAFHGWSEPWLGEGFSTWNLEGYLPAICARKPVPTLVIQGAADEYGTIAQCQAIERGIGPDAKTLFLPDCGHAPHKDQFEQTLSAMVAHINSIV